MDIEGIYIEVTRITRSWCRIEKIYPSVTASDAEINIVTVEVRCSDGQVHKIRAYREEANDLREFIRTEL